MVTQLRHEISEMTTSIKIKEMEITNLKEESKKFAKHYIQKKMEDQASTSLSKVPYTYMQSLKYACIVTYCIYVRMFYLHINIRIYT